jgi:hypothetical protein
LPIAICLVVKDRPIHYFFALERISHITILFAFLSSKNALFAYKSLSIHGVEQAFIPAGILVEETAL